MFHRHTRALLIAFLLQVQVQCLWGSPSGIVRKRSPAENLDHHFHFEVASSTTTIKTTSFDQVSKAEGLEEEAKKIIQNSNSTLNSVDDNEVRIHEADLKDELARWEAPRYIQENYPYYLSGYDEEEGRPIWVMEFGRMNLRSLVEGGGEMLAAFEKYTEQIAYRIIKSIHAANTEKRPVTEAIFLLDFEGLILRDVSSLPVMSFALRLILKNRELIQNFLGPTIFINANFLAENAVRFARPALGPAFQKVEVYGTNKERWIPHLRRLLGPSQIATWYGGDKTNFKPVAVYGR